MTVGWADLFGRLDPTSLVFVRAWADPGVGVLVAAAAAAAEVLGALIVAWLLTVRGGWGRLWKGWLTSLDHKRIGIMYVALALVMFARAIVEAAMMRAQQLVAVDAPGFLSPDHFAQLFSTHGTIMIFFVAMPLLTGLINFVMPLQIGAREVSFPLLNAVSLALTAAGAGLTLVSLVIGEFSTGGWSAYPPYTETAFSPGEGVDYWIWAVTLSSLGSTLTGVNFAVTIYKRRCEGMDLFRMPLFCWTALCASILMIFAMAPLTAATLMLALDRYAGFHFFTNAAGGDMMNYANLFWLFGHPEVYILILPAFGVWSEVISTFSARRLWGYASLVWATMCISVLSFAVWLHHFFTMGQGADVNAAFGIATMVIGVPTGVKVYDWLLTMVGGRIRFATPMLFAIFFLAAFVLGGLTGVLLANPTLDYQVHNSLFLVAHFHNMLIPGTLFAMFAAVQFWFPKAFGFRLDERWGRAAFWCLAPGFLLAFFPLYGLGLMGAPRRVAIWHDPAFAPWLAAAMAGALMMLAGAGCLGWQIRVSIRDRARLASPLGDPWDARTLEWSIPSPPPEWNFAVPPKVEGRDAFAEAKRGGGGPSRPEVCESGVCEPGVCESGVYKDVELPRNSAAPPLIGLFSAACGFALVWHIWWLAIGAFAMCWAAPIARSFRLDVMRKVPAEEIRAAHEAFLAEWGAAPGVSRDDEFTPANRGKAAPEATG